MVSKSKCTKQRSHWVLFLIQWVFMPHSEWMELGVILSHNQLYMEQPLSREKWNKNIFWFQEVLTLQEFEFLSSDFFAFFKWSFILFGILVKDSTFCLHFHHCLFFYSTFHSSNSINIVWFSCSLLSICNTVIRWGNCAHYFCFTMGLPTTTCNSNSRTVMREIRTTVITQLLLPNH